jgi:hypothetical protein
VTRREDVVVAPANDTFVVAALPNVATVVPPLFLMTTPDDPLVWIVSAVTVPVKVGDPARTMFPVPVVEFPRSVVFALYPWTVTPIAAGAR